MKLYELNQMGYQALPTMNERELEDCLPIIVNYITEHLGGQYYMLLNNDLHYYTLFTWKNATSRPIDMAIGLIELASELGEIKSIETNDYDAIEFWIVNKEECNMYVFFNYDQGVIKV